MSQPKPTVTVNGTDYRWPLRPVVVVCIDGGDPRLPAPVPGRRVDPEHRWFRARGFRHGGRRLDAVLHLPEQHVDHHRHADQQARHLGQLLPRHRHLGAGGHDRPGTAARRHDHRQVCRGRRQGGDHHRQGQAAQAAGQGAGCLAGPCVVLQRIRRPVHAGRKRHSERAALAGHGTAGHVLDGAVAAGAGSRHQAAAPSAGPSCCTCR